MKKGDNKVIKHYYILSLTPKKADKRAETTDQTRKQNPTICCYVVTGNMYLVSVSDISTELLKTLEIS